MGNINIVLTPSGHQSNSRKVKRHIPHEIRCIGQDEECFYMSCKMPVDRKYYTAQYVIKKSRFECGVSRIYYILRLELNRVDGNRMRLVVINPTTNDDVTYYSCRGDMCAAEEQLLHSVGYGWVIRAIQTQEE